MERQAMLDRVRAGLEGPAGASQALGMRGHPPAHAVRLVDDGRHLFERHLGGLRILRDDRARARGHELDEVGAAADTMRPHVKMRGPGTTPRSTASFRALASSSKLPTSRTVVNPDRTIRNA